MIEDKFAERKKNAEKNNNNYFFFFFFENSKKMRKISILTFIFLPLFNIYAEE